MQLSRTQREINRKRTLLRTLKNDNAFEASLRLAMEVDMVLNQMDRKLESFDEKQEELLDKYTKKTEDGQPIWETESGHEVVQTSNGWVVHGEEEKEADIDGKIQRAFTDRDALEEELDDLLSKEVEIQIDPISKDLFLDKASLNDLEARRIDLTNLQDLLDS